MGAVVEAPIPQVSLDNMTEYLVDKTMMSSISDNVTESKFLKKLEETTTFATPTRTLGAENGAAFWETWRPSPDPGAGGYVRVYLQDYGIC